MLTRFLVSIFANAVGLWLAASFIAGVHIEGGWVSIVILAGILSVLNVTLKPVLKLLLGPFVILTFGLLLIVLHALMFVVLDFVSPLFTLEGYVPLIATTLVTSVVNIFFTLMGARKRHER